MSKMILKRDDVPEENTGLVLTDILVGHPFIFTDSEDPSPCMVNDAQEFTYLDTGLHFRVMDYSREPVAYIDMLSTWHLSKEEA